MIELRWFYPEHRHVVSDAHGNATAGGGEPRLQMRQTYPLPDNKVHWHEWADVPEVFAP